MTQQSVQIAPNLADMWKGQSEIRRAILSRKRGFTSQQHSMRDPLRAESDMHVSAAASPPLRRYRLHCRRTGGGGDGRERMQMGEKKCVWGGVGAQGTPTKMYVFYNRIRILIILYVFLQDKQ